MADENSLLLKARKLISDAYLMQLNMSDAQKWLGEFSAIVDEKSKAHPKRFYHLVEKGGCGADLTAYGFYFEMAIPMATSKGITTMVQLVVMLPAQCPACKVPLVQEGPASPVQIATPGSLPGLHGIGRRG